MKEHPILFSAPMVRAILTGAKTITRRVAWLSDDALNMIDAADRVGAIRELRVPANADGYGFVGYKLGVEFYSAPIHCPYGAPGDRLWVRETFYCDDRRYKSMPDNDRQRAEFLAEMYYRADATWTGTVSELKCLGDGKSLWKPSIHMPRWASRITLEVTGVRVEQLHDITNRDAWEEGIDAFDGAIDDAKICAAANQLGCSPEDARATFACVWDDLNGQHAPWRSNPWVWCISFRRP